MGGEWKNAALVCATAVVTAISTVVAAGAVLTQSFTDVPPTHPFYDEIEDVADNCVAAGYDDGTYRPTIPVSRQAMAAFLSRSMSRSVQGTDIANPIRFGAPETGKSGPWTTLAEVTVTTPDLPGECTIPVHVDSMATLLSSDTLVLTCRVGNNYCSGQVALFSGDTEGKVASERIKSDYWGAAFSPTQVFEQSDNTTVTYSLRARGFSTQDNGLFASDRNIVATTHPAQAKVTP